jgi:hypothetical protein
MELFVDRDIPRADGAEQVFRMSPWGSLAAYLFFVAWIGAALGLLVYTFYAPEIHGFHWSRIVLVIFILVMWGLGGIYARVYAAARHAGNWLARIGPAGLLIKYRSYLHEDSPAEDPIAVRLSWDEVVRAELQREIFHTEVADEKTEMRRRFLVFKLRCRESDTAKLKAALAFEHQRKPDHFKVNDLKHELFEARKRNAPGSEIAHIKRAIRSEKRRHPGKHAASRFVHRPVTFIDPDLLKVEWTGAAPGRKVLSGLLERYTRFVPAADRHVHADKPMTETEFRALLGGLIERDERIEAVKLVRRQLRCTLVEAKAFIEKFGREEKAA